MVSPAVSVTLQCDGCITVQTDAALRHGAGRKVIAEAPGVAFAFNAGAASVHSAPGTDAVVKRQGS